MATGMGEPGDSGRDELSPLCSLLRRRREEILGAWAAAARELSPARQLPHNRLVDHLPSLLERIAQVADELARGGSPRVENHTATLHALERLEDGFDLGEVVAELSLLRDCILRALGPELPPGSAGELRLLDRALDDAIAASVAQYVEARERALRALDRISTAALEADSVDELLTRLIAAFLEATPSVDVATIFLREGDHLRARASVGLEEEVATELSLRIGEGFAGTIASERRPRETRTAATDPLVRSAAVRTKGVRALYGVPLVDGGALLGVAQMGSLGAHEISEQDKHLFRSMTSRATAGIYQHQLRELAEKRARALSWLEQLVSSHPDFFYVLDREHRFVYASPALLQLWGRSLPDVLGRDFKELGYPAELVALHRGQIAAVLAGETIRAENPFTAPGGNQRHYEYIFTPVRGDDGGVVAVAGVTRDVTARRRAELELAEAVRAREEVLAVVSHDLRNPLGAIATGASILADALPREPRSARVIEAIRRSADRMDHLISDLLDVSSLQAGRFSVRATAVPVRPLVEEMVQAQAPQAHQKGVKLVTEIPAADLCARCDRGRTLQILGNLLGNAVKFGRAGDEVVVRARRANGDVEIEVADTGPGIRPDELPHLFDPYWSGRGHAGAGTGLGLYISKGIAEAQGGRLWVESAPGAGSTFTFSLPAA